jgi:hypothetical protein
MRHIFSWWDGQNNDVESGQPHLAHAIACLMILLDARLTDDLNDDRPRVGLTAGHIALATRKLEAAP